MADDTDAPVSFRQGVVQEWNPDTADITVQVAGGTLLNIPVLTSESAALAVGDVVSLATDGKRWLLFGKVTTPGDPGTVPSWNADITALTGQVDEIQTVTIPAVQNDVTIVQGDVVELNTVTVPAVQATADAAQSTADSAAADAAAAVAAAADALGKFPIAETDIQDGAISTPKLAANAIDGLVITGVWMRTSAGPGPRIGLNDPDYPNEAVLYSGNAAETVPGRLLSVAPSGLQAQTVLRSPELDSGARAQIGLTSDAVAIGGKTHAQTDADEIFLNTFGAGAAVKVTESGIELNRPVVNANLTSSTNTFPADPQPVTVNDLTLINPVSSTTYAPASPVCGTTFVAPPSGKVYVTVSAEIRGTVSNAFARMSFEIRAGGTVGSGTVHTAASDFRAVVGGQFGGAESDFRHGGSRECLITGLTVGSTYNIRTMYVFNAGSGAIYMRELLIKPVL